MNLVKISVHSFFCVLNYSCIIAISHTCIPIFGSVISAAMLTVLPQVLREFRDYRMLIYAIVLILVMIITNNDKLKDLKDTLTAKLFKKGNKKEAAK